MNLGNVAVLSVGGRTVYLLDSFVDFPEAENNCSEDRPVENFGKDYPRQRQLA
jgi:hypothetical protein